ncbi:MAG: murein L,D-transpeptidase catalytic domain family protein [Flavipsychrobacter sp.]
MKKVLLVLMCFLTTVGLQKATAIEADASISNKIRYHIAQTYNSIDFSKVDSLSYIVFAKAYYGYINLYNEGMLNAQKHMLTICDFTLSANTKRMWVIDLEKKKVVLNTHVSHGQASGKEYAQVFSNKTGSHKSSIGFYITAETYSGKHGYSLRLFGMDKGFNSAAYNRDIVVHGASYVSTEFIRGNQCLGRSWGCPAVSNELSEELINTIKDNTCLYIHFPEARYLKSSLWLNKPITELPQFNPLDFALQHRDTVIKYNYGREMKRIIKYVNRFHFPLF